jgi:hypothetical protein
MEEKPGNKNRNIIIIVAAVVVLGCLCVAAGIAGFFAFTTISSKTTVPIQPTEIITPLEATPQTDTSIGDPPVGGKGNDILRNDTWKVVAPAAVGLGCDQPIGADSTIEVLQEPDSAGHWTEKWTVVCHSGKTYAFQVDFILDSTGTTFNIKSLP